MEYFFDERNTWTPFSEMISIIMVFISTDYRILEKMFKDLAAKRNQDYRNNLTGQS